MEKLIAFLNLGFEHILDPNGIDHLLFIVALTIAQGYKNWKRTAILVTAFTLGHCLSLILSGLQVISLNQELVEFLIPITILITALVNIVLYKKSIAFRVEYSLASLFGLIHGLGFSNYFRAISFKDESIISQLLSFNIGVELGQLAIVFVTIALEWVIVKFFGFKHEYWMKGLSILIAIYALKMIFTS